MSETLGSKKIGKGNNMYFTNFTIHENGIIKVLVPKY